jgi:hypothetical protein
MSAKPRRTPQKQKKNETGIHCSECNRLIQTREQALFVEEEVGRYFCEESCIVAHFTPEIEKMERDYGRHVPANDLNTEERERYAHLRWATIEEPEEVWREKVSSGDDRYTLVSRFEPEGKEVWGVAVCLMLRKEPSFLFIAFVTSDESLVNVFRRGELQKGSSKKETLAPLSEESEETQSSISEKNDFLAEPWSESDSVRASILKNRKDNDIPVDDFAFYQKCLEETLQEPTELWSFATAKQKKRVYHFIREYEHDSNYWYIVIAKDAADETQIEIIDAFPTKDRQLMELCRHGKREVLDRSDHSILASEPENKKRTVH